MEDFFTDHFLTANVDSLTIWWWTGWFQGDEEGKEYGRKCKSSHKGHTRSPWQGPTNEPPWGDQVMDPSWLGHLSELCLIR